MICALILTGDLKNKRAEPDNLPWNIVYYIVPSNEWKTWFLIKLIGQLIHKTRPSRFKITDGQNYRWSTYYVGSRSGRVNIKALKIEITAFTWFSSLFFKEMLLSLLDNRTQKWFIIRYVHPKIQYFPISQYKEFLSIYGEIFCLNWPVTAKYNVFNTVKTCDWEPGF